MQIMSAMKLSSSAPQKPGLTWNAFDLTSNGKRHINEQTRHENEFFKFDIRPNAGDEQAVAL